MVKKSIIWLIFVVGVLVFSYPLLSNWLSTKEHHSVISEHNEALKKLTAQEKMKEREKAEAYNASLDEQSIPVSDPFSTGAVQDENAGYYNVLDIGETMGNLIIPSINVNLPIYHGVSDDVLQRGVGHMSNSSFPVGGLNTHTALTGHRGLPSSKLFRNLDELKIGDRFSLHILDEILVYEVEDVKIVLPTETSWLEMREDKDFVTLITCEPYMINTHRLLVRGERIDDDILEAEEAVAGVEDDNFEEKQRTFSIPILLLFIAIIIGLTSFVVWKQRRRRG